MHACVYVCVCVCVTVLPLSSAASRLTNFMRLCCHTGAMNDVAADITLSSEENKTTPDLSHALDKLTQSRLESRLQGRRHFLRSTLQAGVGRLQGVAGVGRGWCGVWLVWGLVDGLLAKNVCGGCVEGLEAL